jgi:hypothetical protein
MSFHIYRIEKTATSTRLHPVADLRPTGAQGPIARFITAHAHEETPFAWTLVDEAILQLAMPDLDPTRHRIVLRLPTENGGAPLFQRLIGIRGQSEMMDTSAVLVTRPLSAPTTSPAESLPTLTEGASLNVDTMEAISLSGGTLGGRFFWRRPKMNIGAAIRPPNKTKPAARVA